ncbi:MAG: hypothetical protein II943_09545 [Victivallales bacterium]|nr:hypothetical protein [Victivallales bacterium]
MPDNRPIRCPNCRKWFRTEENHALVLCPHCSTPIHLLHAPDASPPKPLPVPQRINSLLQQAWQNHRAGNNTFAAEDFADVLALNPKCAEAWAGRGLCLALLEHEKLHAFYGEALNCLEQAVQCDPAPRTQLLAANARYEICAGLHEKLYRRFRGKTWDWGRWLALLDPESFIRSNLKNAYYTARKWMDEPPAEGCFPTELPPGQTAMNSQERATALAIDCAQLHIYICRHYLIGGVGFNPTGLGFTLAQLKAPEERQYLSEMNDSASFLKTVVPNYQLLPYHTAFQKLCWFHASYAIFAVLTQTSIQLFRPDLWSWAFLRLVCGYLFAWVPFIAWWYRPIERSGPVHENESFKSTP